MRGRDRRGTPDHLRPPPRQHRAGRARQAGGDLARPRGARGAGARPARGRPGHGEDRARAGDRADDRGRDRHPDPVHARPPADRRHRALVYDQKTREFEFRPGPIFANIVLVDEINRAMPKTQSALLEAMAERQVTVDGVTRPLPSPFLVIATENPIEQEGTFPLPEAQLDRFALRAALGYPDEERRDRDRARAAARPSARRARAARVAPTTCARLQAARRERLHRRAHPALDGRARARDARASTASSSAPPCAAASRSSARRARGRCCTAATTCCPRTSTALPARCSGTACCSRRRSSPRRARSAATRRSRASRTAASSSRRRPRPDWDAPPRRRLSRAGARAADLPARAAAPPPRRAAVRRPPEPPPRRTAAT